MCSFGGIVISILIALIPWDAVAALATCALVVLGLFTLYYANTQIQDFRKENRITHLIDLVTQFETEPFVSIRKRLGKARIVGNNLRELDLENPPAELYDVMNFFEHVGFLLDGGYLDLEGVSVELHYWILHVWADAQELIKQEQVEEDPIYYEMFDKMAKRLLEYDRPRTGKLGIPSKDDVEGFYADEAELAADAPISRARRRKRPT
jgi:hypothetical protein